MRNNTFEDYKKAIKIKYEIEKEGAFFNFLTPPSQANLRNLCWEKFKANPSKEDLNIFSSFFGFDFDSTKKNHFKEQTDKFRPVGSFLKGQKEPANKFAVEFAAILVDFKERPFQKFRESGVAEVEKQKVSPNDFGPEEVPEVMADQLAEESIFKPLNRKWDVLSKFREKIKLTSIGVVVFLGLGFGVIYYIFPKKQCMQWSNDHYEIVDCDLKADGFMVSNKVEVFDERKCELRKINVCDTTTCFNKNGEAVVWYAKTEKGIDFFNTHGIHPETEKPLKAVTKYILNKYVK